MGQIGDDALVVPLVHKAQAISQHMHHALLHYRPGKAFGGPLQTSDYRRQRIRWPLQSSDEASYRRQRI